MKRLLVTGTREGWDHDELRFILHEHWEALGGGGDVTLVHGGARGVDRQAAHVWSSQGLPVEVHEADWETYGKGAGPYRNQKMVDLGAEQCVAFVLLGSSRGTQDCMERARNAGIPVHSYTRSA